MKKVLTIIWTLAMVAIILFFLRSLFTNNKPTFLIPEIEKSTDVFSRKTLDSLLSNNEYVLLTVGYGDCNVCDWFRLDTTPDKFPVGRYYIDAAYHNTNRLVMQSLRPTGFPLSYVIDQNYNIIGATAGLAALEERLDSIIYGQYKLMPAIPGVPKEKTHALTSNSFKALLAYFENDHKSMKNYAEASLAAGSSFFNRYLLYKYFERFEVVDSVEYYRKRLLTGITHSDDIVYEDLLTEIDPDNNRRHYLHKEHHHEGCDHH